MAISFNNSANPTAVTFNGNTVNEVIFNGVSVWTAGIPSIYRQLEYIEANSATSGTSGPHILLNTYADEVNTFDIKAMWYSVGTWSNWTMIGVEQSGGYYPGLMIRVRRSDGQMTVRWGGYSSDSHPLTGTANTVNKDLEFIGLGNANSYTINGTSYSFTPDTTNTPPHIKVTLFCQHNSSDSFTDHASGRMYYVKLYGANSNLICNLIPVIRITDSVVGLYDTVSKQFYVNSGSGSFIAGPEILPDTYTLLEYIEATGTQYIDTGVSGGSSCKYMISGMIKNTGVVNTYQHFFAGSDQSTFPKIFQNNSSTSTPTANIVLQSKASGSNVSIGLTDLYNVKFNIDYAMTQANRVTLNATVQSTNITNSGWGTNTVYVFGRHETASKLCVGRVYHLEMYTGNSLVRYYVPVKRNSDDELGLFDLVTQTFYTNQGTGSFIGG